MRGKLRFFTAPGGVAKCRFENLNWDVPKQNVVNWFNHFGKKIKESVMVQIEKYIKVKDLEF